MLHHFTILNVKCLRRKSFPVVIVIITIRIKENLESISKDLSCLKVTLRPFELWEQVANC